MVFFSPQTALVLGLGVKPNIDVDNELLGPIPLQYLWKKKLNFTFISLYVTNIIAYNLFILLLVSVNIL